MSSFIDILRWYNNKDVVPTSEAMQKMIDFYHEKDTDMLKRGCTLPNLANICLRKTTDAKFYPSMEGDKDLLEEIREDIVVGSSIVFTCKTFVDETFTRKSTNLCKSITGIDGCQLYSHSMCQFMPTSLYTRWNFDSETRRFISRQKKTRSFEKLVMSYSNDQDQKVKLKASLQQADRKKLSASVLMGFVLTATLCLKPWFAFAFSVPVKSCVFLSLKRIFSVVARRESSMHGDYTIYKKKASTLLKCGSAIGGECTKQPIMLNKLSENPFLTDVHLQLSNFWKK